MTGWSSPDYFMSGDQLTNQPTGTNYLSLRLTLSHQLKDDIIEKVFSDVDQYIMYLHKPGSTNEHFHIYVPIGDRRDVERYRKRVITHYPGCRGNKGYSIKCYDNGVRGFVFYCHHEGAQPIFKGDFQGIIDEVVTHGVYKKPSAYREGSGTEKKIREKMSNPQLTLSNLLKQAQKYREQHQIATFDLGKVVCHMVNNGWDAAQTLKRQGIPVEDYEIFAARCGKKELQEQDWMKPHKRAERKGDYDEIDSDYQMVKRPCLIPRPHD